jgi:hypothetical protein
VSVRYEAKGLIKLKHYKAVAHNSKPAAFRPLPLVMSDGASDVWGTYFDHALISIFLRATFARVSSASGLGVSGGSEGLIKHCLTPHHFTSKRR